MDFSLSVRPIIKKHGLDRGEHPTVVSGPAEAARERHSGSFLSAL
ncbi:unnamed protein product [Penicillium camemberti]|uniref:Str. FM013 n=1 Tax=Penicillium camemberti (strain FM 013) TaxID=1429867 RepID=A0A0G4NU99_PENC3|nr:unnamed protein product [Penicillium camemberti]